MPQANRQNSEPMKALHGSFIGGVNPQLSNIQQQMDIQAQIQLQHQKLQQLQQLQMQQNSHQNNNAQHQDSQYDDVEVEVTVEETHETSKDNEVSD